MMLNKTLLMPIGLAVIVFSGLLFQLLHALLPTTSLFVP